MNSNSVVIGASGAVNHSGENMENRRIITIDDIKESDLPLLVLVDNRRSFLSWAIKAHSEGQYNHIMEMTKLTHFASQDMAGFKEVPVKQYLKSYITLKFWKPKNLTLKQKQDWIDDIDFDLSGPWWKRRYDFIGLVGQLINIRWINNPWLNYCSERVRDRIVTILGVFGDKHRTPNEWNIIFNKSDKMEVFGYIMED